MKISTLRLGLAVVILFLLVQFKTSYAGDPTALIAAGDVLYSQRAASCSKASEAINRWRDALKADSSAKTAYEKIATAHFFLGRYCKSAAADADFAKGLEAAGKMLSIDEKDAAANYWVAALTMEINERKDPKAYLAMRNRIQTHLMKARSLKPDYDNGGPDRLIGRLLFHSPLINLEEAEKHLRAAAEIAPEESSNLLLLGELLIKQKKFDEAKDLMTRLSDSRPAHGNDKELAADQAQGKILLESLTK